MRGGRACAIAESESPSAAGVRQRAEPMERGRGYPAHVGALQEPYERVTVEHFHEQLRKQQNYEPGWTVTRLANVVRPCARSERSGLLSNRRSAVPLTEPI